jgi:hypothetical protein
MHDAYWHIKNHILTHSFSNLTEWPPFCCLNLYSLTPHIPESNTRRNSEQVPTSIHHHSLFLLHTIISDIYLPMFLLDLKGGGASHRFLCSLSCLSYWLALPIHVNLSSFNNLWYPQVTKYKQGDAVPIVSPSFLTTWFCPNLQLTNQCFWRCGTCFECRAIHLLFWLRFIVISYGIVCLFCNSPPLPRPKYMTTNDLYFPLILNIYNIHLHLWHY